MNNIYSLLNTLNKIERRIVEARQRLSKVESSFDGLEEAKSETCLDDAQRAIRNAYNHLSHRLPDLPEGGDNE